MKKKHVLIAMALMSPFGAFAEPGTTIHPDIAQTWISFLPIIFFFLILIVTAFKLKTGDGQSSGLLAEKDKQAAPVKDADGDNPTPPQSVSRLIALLTGLVALVIGICLATFSMYCYFSDSKHTLPDLANLNTVIFGLGIGVLPYGFNKASSAIKS